MSNVQMEDGEMLLIGNHQSVYGLAVCLLQAGHRVILETDEEQTARESIRTHIEDIVKWKQTISSGESVETLVDTLEILGDDQREKRFSASMAIAVTGEKREEKMQAIGRLEAMLPPDTPIGINTESIPLSEIQKVAINPERIVGMNWVDPVYNSLFLEIIRNDTTTESVVTAVLKAAKSRWKKDPYVITGELGIRMPLLAALIREAFSLVEKDYATVEDIDRACRNDAGYYLPFAGNLRYMDLMGTYAYGMVMKDLNPELANDNELPVEFLSKLDRGETGMKAGAGFYRYTEKERENWRKMMRKFSFEVKELLERYPFGEKKDEQ